MRAFGRLISLLLAGVYFGRVAFAVFQDEAYKSDWQWMNIGEYKCVIEDNHGSFLILSDLGDQSMLSSVNRTDGTILYRRPLPFKAFDLMLVDGGKKMILKVGRGQFELIDTENSFHLGTYVGGFQSSCIPNYSGIRFDGDKLKVLDKITDLEIFHAVLPNEPRTIKYVDTDQVGYLSLLVEHNDLYYYSEYHDGELTNKWSRDESITDIVDFTYVSEVDNNTNMIYSEWNTEGSLNIFRAYIYRVKQNWGRLKHLLVHHKKSPGAILTDILKEDEEETLKQRNLKFGFLKKLIVATKKGKIAAINMENGEKLWAFDTNLSDIIALETAKKESEIFIFTNRGLTLVVDLRNQYEPHIKQKATEFATEKVGRLGSSDDFYLRGSDGSTIMFADNSINGFSSVIVDHTSSSINAYIVENGALYQIWKIETQEDEVIVAFAPRDDAPVSNIGTILGNRTVLYRYLNPNLASYIVGNKKLNLITVNVVDLVTGNIIHSVYENKTLNLDQPINLVFGEHWIIYSYFSHNIVAEQRISVIEMYESLQPNSRVSVGSIVQDALKNDIRPQFVSQSFIFPEVIKEMIISRTKFGITSKAIVLKLENGQITYLPKFLLNARSVEKSKMSATDLQEFMAAPYVSTIPINDNFIITHHRNIVDGNKSKLISIATNLESTSFICSLSHDIFCTKISPSSQFDKLSPSFEKGKLFATIIGLLCVCYFLRPIVDTRKLKSKWLVKENYL